MIEACNGSQLAAAAESKALPTMIVANAPADTRVCRSLLGPVQAATEMFSTRSIGTHASLSGDASIPARDGTQVSNLRYSSPGLLDLRIGIMSFMFSSPGTTS